MTSIYCPTDCNEDCSKCISFLEMMDYWYDCGDVIIPSPEIDQIDNSYVKLKCYVCGKYTDLEHCKEMYAEGTPSVYKIYCSDKCIVADEL